MKLKQEREALRRREEEIARQVRVGLLSKNIKIFKGVLEYLTPKAVFELNVCSSPYLPACEDIIEWKYCFAKLVQYLN